MPAESNDPRGPLRKTLAVEPDTQGTLVQLECGHVRILNQIYTYKVGDLQRCFECLQAKVVAS